MWRYRLFKPTVRRRTAVTAAALFLVISVSMIAQGGANADVEYVKATYNGNGVWTFDVTVRHPDTGWDDYADGWDIVTPEGTVLKANKSDEFTRELLHPHTDEQPFTRSQTLEIPSDVQRLTVRAHDLIDGWGGKEVLLDLTEKSGEDWEVVRP